jgi:hypothetical protein
MTMPCVSFTYVYGGTGLEKRSFLSKSAFAAITYIHGACSFDLAPFGSSGNAAPSRINSFLLHSGPLASCAWVVLGSCELLVTTAPSWPPMTILPGLFPVEMGTRSPIQVSFNLPVSI